MHFSGSKLHDCLHSCNTCSPRSRIGECAYGALARTFLSLAQQLGPSVGPSFIQIPLPRPCLLSRHVADHSDSVGPRRGPLKLIPWPSTYLVGEGGFKLNKRFKQAPLNKSRKSANQIGDNGPHVGPIVWAQRGPPRPPRSWLSGGIRFRPRVRR